RLYRVHGRAAGHVLAIGRDPMTSPPGESSAGSPSTQAPDARARTHPVRPFVRASACHGWTIYCLARVLVARARKGDASGKRAASLNWTHRWLAGCARVMGIRIAVHGEPPRPGTMLAPNHLGYLDIVALGVAHPSFYVVKAE